MKDRTFLYYTGWIAELLEMCQCQVKMGTPCTTDDFSKYILCMADFNNQSLTDLSIFLLYIVWYKQSIIVR